MRSTALFVLFASLILMTGQGFAADVDASNYCSTGDGGNDDDWIDGVDFDSISTSVYDLGYRDMTDHSATVNRGESYRISVYIGQENSWDQNLAVWVDSDDDGSLSDENRQKIGDIGYSGTVSGYVNIPSDSETGATLMRVSEEYYEYPGPCDDMYYGGVRDYTLVIGSTNSAPNEPTNPEPNNGETIETTSPNLQLDVSDPDGDSMDVTYYSSQSNLNERNWDFTTCGASGNTGPSENQCDNEYSGTNLQGEVNVVNPGIQEWTVPADGTYQIRAAGAGGSGSHPMGGAVVQGTFQLQEGTTLQILVGQQGSDSGGGGGTFVATGGSHTSANPLLVAGGGTGGDYIDSDIARGSTNTYGKDSPSGPNGGNNGYGGDGGDGGGGAGFYGNGGDGSYDEGGQAFRNGGEGSTNYQSIGGFGGGGAAEDYGDEQGGAGGYSGGAATEDGSNSEEVSGGGGSFIDSSATSGATSTGSFSDSSSNDNGYDGAVSDLGGYNSGNGYVNIDYQGNLLGTDSNVASGSTSSYEWSGLSCGNSYNWYAVVSDGQETTQSSTYGFDIYCNSPPSSPTNPSPSDGSTIQDESPTLQVDVSDPDNEGLNVEFMEYQGWNNVLSWDRENNGDTLSDLRNRMDVRRDFGIMYDHQSNYLRWAESDSDGANLYRKTLPSNTGKLRADIHFEWESYESSGAYFWAEDVNGNRYKIKCDDDGRYDYFNCATDDSYGSWDGTFTVDAPYELRYFYMGSDLENAEGEWWDRAQLYRLNVDVKEASSIGTDTSVDGSGDTATYTWNGASCGTNNEWLAKVREDDGEASSQSNVWNFQLNCEKPPNDPSNLQPSGTGTDITPQINASYSDPNGDSGTLYFETGSGSSIGSCNVNDGGSCGVTYSSADQWGQQYTFQVYAEDSTGKTSDRVSQTFTVNHKPQVSNLRPSGTGIKVNPTLKADISDGDSNDEINVRFVNRDNGQVIGTDSLTGSGTAQYDTSGADFGSQHGTTYNYRAVADDGQVTSSASQSFTTNYRPSIDSFQVPDSDSEHAFSVLVNVSDQNGEEDIEKCELVVDDGDGNSKTYTINSPTGGSNSNDAECDYLGINYTEMSGWDHTEQMNIDFTVKDSNDQTETRSTSNQFPNNGPQISGIDITDYRDRKAFKISSFIDFPDDGSSEIRSCSITIDDGEKTYSAGTMTVIDDSTIKCVEDNVGSDKFSGLTVDEELKISVQATDIHGKTSTSTTLYNVPTGIDYDYTAVVLQSGTTDFLDYRVSSGSNTKSKFRSTLSGVNATFVDSGGSTATYNLSEGETSSLTIQVRPQEGEYGSKTLKVVTKNLDTGIKQVHELPVQVKRNSNPTEMPVPGLGLLQILILISSSLIVYFKRQEI